MGDELLTEDDVDTLIQAEGIIRRLRDEGVRDTPITTADVTLLYGVFPHFVDACAAEVTADD